MLPGGLLLPMERVGLRDSDRLLLSQPLSDPLEVIAELVGGSRRRSISSTACPSSWAIMQVSWTRGPTPLRKASMFPCSSGAQIPP